MTPPHAKHAAPGTINSQVITAMLFVGRLVPRRRPDGFVMEQDGSSDEEAVTIKKEQDYQADA